MGRNFHRALGVLQADKTVLGGRCKALVVQDLERKLDEYFERSSPLVLQIQPAEGGYTVTLQFRAERVKQFRVLGEGEKLQN